jgi:hypothetical protein
MGLRDASGAESCEAEGGELRAGPCADAPALGILHSISVSASAMRYAALCWCRPQLFDSP